MTLANDSEYVLWVYTFTARGPFLNCRKVSTANVASGVLVV